MPFPVAGLVPILATPFLPDGTLDRPGLRRLVEFQAGCEVAGIGVFGLASEGFSLTAEEKSIILAEVRGVLGPDGCIVAGINATSTATAVEQALAAADGGADALMVLPPFLTKQPAGRLGDFFATVADRGGLPVMVQDAPAATGVTMSVPALVELSKLRGVDAVKIETQPTAPKVGAVVDATGAAALNGQDWAVFGGQNALFVLEEYARGAVGTMPACEFADELAVLLRDLADDRTEDAHRAFNLLLPLIRFGLQPGIAHAVHKDILVRRGVINYDTVRDPVLPLDPGSRAALDLIWRMHPLPTWAG